MTITDRPFTQDGGFPHRHHPRFRKHLLITTAVPLAVIVLLALYLASSSGSGSSDSTGITYDAGSGNGKALPAPPTGSVAAPVQSQPTPEAPPVATALATIDQACASGKDPAGCLWSWWNGVAGQLVTTHRVTDDLLPSDPRAMNVSTEAIIAHINRWAHEVPTGVVSSGVGSGNENPFYLKTESVAGVVLSTSDPLYARPGTNGGPPQFVKIDQSGQDVTPPVNVGGPNRFWLAQFYEPGATGPSGLHLVRLQAWTINGLGIFWTAATCPTLSPAACPDS